MAWRTQANPGSPNFGSQSRSLLLEMHLYWCPLSAGDQPDAAQLPTIDRKSLLPYKAGNNSTLPVLLLSWAMSMMNKFKPQKIFLGCAWADPTHGLSGLATILRTGVRGGRTQDPRFWAIGWLAHDFRKLGSPGFARVDRDSDLVCLRPEFYHPLNPRDAQ